MWNNKAANLESKQNSLIHIHMKTLQSSEKEKKKGKEILYIWLMYEYIAQITFSIIVRTIAGDGMGRLDNAEHKNKIKKLS